MTLALCIGANTAIFTVLDGVLLRGLPFPEPDRLVAILSEGLWKDMFGRDRNVLGRDIRLSGVQHRIVGVLPDRFASLGGEPPRVWLPFAFTPQ